VAIQLAEGTMTDKEIVIDLLRRLPEDASLKTISEEVAILAAIRRGETAAAAGRVVAHAEVKSRSSGWISEPSS
jgi:predicted transcriptional regulator